MKHTFKDYLFLVSFLFFSIAADAAIISRVTSFSDGEVLFAGDLNDEFNNMLSGINSINNDQIATNANISASKLSASIAGDGISRNGTTGALSVGVDDTTIEIDSNDIQVKDNGIGDAQIRQSAAVSVIGNATIATANVADITASGNDLVLMRKSNALSFAKVDTAQIADNAVTQEKMEVRDTGTSVGLGGVGVTSNLASQALTSSFADLTGLSVTITTMGNPVKLQLIGGSGSAEGQFACDNGTQSQNEIQVRFVKDATNLSIISFKTGTVWSAATFVDSDMDIGASAFSHIDFPTAGTYTYKVQATETNLSGASCTAQNLKLVAYEL